MAAAAARRPAPANSKLGARRSRRAGGLGWLVRSPLRASAVRATWSANSPRDRARATWSRLCRATSRRRSRSGSATRDRASSARLRSVPVGRGCGVVPAGSRGDERRSAAHASGSFASRGSGAASRAASSSPAVAAASPETRPAGSRSRAKIARAEASHSASVRSGTGQAARSASTGAGSSAGSRGFMAAPTTLQRSRVARATHGASFAPRGHARRWSPRARPGPPPPRRG